MTNDELKKKIVEIMSKIWEEPVPCTAERKFERIADALIAAWIGDVSKWKAYAKVHRIVITKDDKIKQLYSDEEVDKIVSERAEYKHRAEVAERALRNRARQYVDLQGYSAWEVAILAAEFVVPNDLKQAEKELERERKE